MRFSLRTLLFITTIACAVMAWAEFHGLGYRYFWPLTWLELVGITLLVIAHVTNSNLGLSLSIGGSLMITWNAFLLSHSPLMTANTHSGNSPGEAEFVERAMQYSAAAVVFPAIALLVCIQRAVNCRQAFTLLQQILLAATCLAVVIDFVVHVYFVNYIALSG